MKIKTLMEFLQKDAGAQGEVQNVSLADGGRSSLHDENVVYMEGARSESLAQRRELICTGTEWADHRMGDILVQMGLVTDADVERIVSHQRDKGLYFGEAALELKLLQKEDILHALSVQFGYTYNRSGGDLSEELAMACTPFGDQAEEFRAIRGQLLSDWLAPGRNILAVVSPETGDGRSYVAANLAMAFSQLGRSTLLIDANLRAPRQHEIFKFERRIGLSTLLAGRMRLEDLDVLPDQVSTFQFLSVLGCGAVPPNPAELLSGKAFVRIMHELRQFYEIIIIDTPSAKYSSDIIAIASVAGSALLVIRRGRSQVDHTKTLMSILSQARAEVVGAVLNEC